MIKMKNKNKIKLRLSRYKTIYLLFIILWFILFGVGLGIDWYHIGELKATIADSPWYGKILETIISYPRLPFRSTLKLNDILSINYFTIGAGVLGIIVSIMAVKEEDFSGSEPDVITEHRVYDLNSDDVTTYTTSAHASRNLWIKIGLVLLCALFMFISLQVVPMVVILTIEIYKWEFRKPQFIKTLLFALVIALSASTGGSMIKLLTIQNYTYNEYSGIRGSIQSLNLDEDFSYIDDDYLSIDSYNHNAKKIVMKSSVNNKKIYTIGRDAFARATRLEEVVLPSNLLTLGSEFYSSSNLKKITLPDTLLILHALAIPESVEHVVLPSSIFKIESNSLNTKTIFYARASSRPNSWPASSVEGVSIYWENEWHFDTNKNPVLN